MKVLIIRLSAMGDIVHGLPAAALLKERLPGLELSWLVEPAGVPLLEGNPAVDRVIVFPKKKWLQQLRTVSRLYATAAEAKTWASELKTLQFDAAIDFQGLLKSSVLGLVSGARKRFGFQGTREGADKFLTHRLDVGDYFSPETHVVEHNLRLADFAARVLLGQTESSADQSYIYEAKFPLPAPSATSLETLKLNAGQSFEAFLSRPGQRRFAFIPGTTWTTKIWDWQKWAELAEMCSETTRLPLLLLGGPSELEMNQHIADRLGSRVLNLTGKTDIPMLLELFRHVDTVIGADTGPLHLAAAVGMPQVLAVFGSTPYKRNGPYGAHCCSVALNLECQPCFKKVCPLGTLACLKELSAKQVFAAIPEES